MSALTWLFDVAVIGAATLILGGLATGWFR